MASFRQTLRSRKLVVGVLLYCGLVYLTVYLLVLYLFILVPGILKPASHKKYKPRNDIPYYVLHGNATSHPIPDHPKLLIHPPNYCTHSMEYILYVHSAPTNYGRRQMIRSTWGDVSLFRSGLLGTVFILGLSGNQTTDESVRHEARVQGDIIVGDFIDSYVNLTLKALTGLSWLKQHCNSTRYAVKTDDDAFIHIIKLASILAKAGPRSVVCPMWGMGQNHMRILREPPHCRKWCISRHEFRDQKYFPQYCAGLVYALHTALIAEIYKASFTVPFFWVDDVYVTGLLLDRVKNVSRTSLVQNLYLKPNITSILNQYHNTSTPINTYFVHMHKNMRYMSELWHAALEKLTAEEMVWVNGTTLDRHRQRFL